MKKQYPIQNTPSQSGELLINSIFVGVISANVRSILWPLQPIFEFDYMKNGNQKLSYFYALKNLI